MIATMINALDNKQKIHIFSVLQLTYNLNLSLILSN